MRELTWLAILLGVLIGALLAAANVYVGLKVGMTVSASIPAAVISMAILRGILKRGTIRENNIVQTIGSAGESLAAGVIFTIPALFMWGINPAFLDMVVWAGIGGLLGVAFMVPLRRVLIVKEHGKLPYPEGVACAEVLESGEQGGAGARKVFYGLGLAGIYETLRQLAFWKDKMEVPVQPAGTNFQTAFQLDASPALLGVGYILGARVAGYLLGGAVLGWFVIIPSIAYFGANDPELAFPPAGIAHEEISAEEARTTYLDHVNDVLYESKLRYIGAGAVAVGGLLSLIKSGKTIFASLFHVIGGIFAGRRRKTDRADRDLPFPLLLLIILGLGYVMWQLPQVKIGHAGAIAVVVAAFLFVTVSSRLVGLVGSSSNPISGMTIATLLGTALVFSYCVGTDMPAKVAALSVGAIVCIAIGVAGDTSQDLKTGFLVRATPWKQQVGEIIGVLTASIVVVWVLRLLNHTYGFGEDSPLIAPQANIMKLVVEGVMDADLPWVLIIAGGAVAVVVELFGLPALPVAVGLYLPLGLSTPIMVGGLVRWLIDRKAKRARENESEAANPGILTASGFVAGEGLIGVAMAGVAAFVGWAWSDPKFLVPGAETAEFVRPEHFAPWLWQRLGWDQWHDWGMTYWAHDLLPLVPFALLVLWLLVSALRRMPPAIPPGGVLAAGPPTPIMPPKPRGPTEPSAEGKRVESLLSYTEVKAEQDDPLKGEKVSG